MRDNIADDNLIDSTQPLESVTQPLSSASSIATENYDEDIFKPEGQLVLKIEEFSKYAKNSQPNEEKRTSEPVYIRGLPWKILIMLRSIGHQDPRLRISKTSLAFFVQCNADSEDQNWNCGATATLRIKSQKEGQEDSVRKINHNFNHKENDWGFTNFFQCDTLLDPANGWIDENDAVTLVADVSADAPHGVDWDSKKHTGFVGLKNQGATCYLNSILQTLFFTSKLRKAVYQMPIEEDEPDNSVALAMQRVFYDLQFSTDPVGTRKLTKSFGWDSIDSFLQHDVQELCRVLLDKLESKMKSTKVADTIPSLFKGRMKSYIKCKHVDFESSREESFYDVQLNVKGKRDIIESFKDYTEPEILDGENKYDAGEQHGLQPAEKGVKFLSFPPVLHLQLMRFQYDPVKDANVKIDDRYEFPDVLVLNEFVDECGEKEDYTYLLHAVLVHSGSFSGGHYVVFINTNLNGTNPRWCKFDDDVVSRVTFQDAVSANFGGDDPEFYRRATNAYMLVYVKKSALDDVLSPILEDDIPAPLKARLENEKHWDEMRRQEREVNSRFFEIMLVTDEDFKVYTGFDLFDMRMPEVNRRRLFVEKDITVPELYAFVAENLDLEAERDFRLWAFNFDPPAQFIPRPRKLLLCDPDQLEEDVLDVPAPGNLFLGQNTVIYLELGKYHPTGRQIVLPIVAEDDFIYFVKFYNRERKSTEYKGTLIIQRGEAIVDYSDDICALIKVPVGTELNLYLELGPKRIIPINYNTLPHEWNGGILVVEITSQVTADSNVPLYFENLFHQVEVEALVNMDGGLTSSVNTEAPPVKGQIQLDWNLVELCAWIGRKSGYDAQKLLLWRVDFYTGKPSQCLSRADSYDEYRVMEMLSLTSSNAHYDPRERRCFKVFYTKLPIPTAELKDRCHVVLQVLNENLQLSEMAIFPRKDGTVQDLLDEAEREFKFSESGTGVLRIVHTSSSIYSLRVFRVLDNAQPYMDYRNKFSVPAFQLRVEEVPKDQLEIAPEEHLLPVAHFDKEPLKMFGVPFFIKIRHEEKIASIRRRIKEMLEVPEREFEKYKFFIVMGNRILRAFDNNDEEAVVNLPELIRTHIAPHPTSAPYLGIDHMNKSRGKTQNLEKAIVIHN